MKQQEIFISILFGESGEDGVVKNTDYEFKLFLYTNSDRFSRDEFLKRITNTANGYLRKTEI
jgi:hypothetical protein